MRFQVGGIDHQGITLTSLSGQLHQDAGENAQPAPTSPWVRETWPERPGLIAIDGKTSRRSHDHAGGTNPRSPGDD